MYSYYTHINPQFENDFNEKRNPFQHSYETHIKKTQFENDIIEKRKPFSVADNDKHGRNK